MRTAGITTNQPEIAQNERKNRRGTGRGQYLHYLDYAKPFAIVTLLSTGSIFLPTERIPTTNFVRNTSSGTPEKNYAKEIPKLGQSSQTLGTSEKIHILRRLSGLTWEQIAALFNVDRRSVHLWANGKPMHPKNEEKLGRILSVALRIDRGFASVSRTVLTTPTLDGRIPLDLLAAGEFDEVVKIVGTGVDRASPNILLSDNERTHRHPTSPLLLAESTHEDEPPSFGKVLTHQPIKPAKGDA